MNVISDRIVHLVKLSKFLCPYFRDLSSLDLEWLLSSTILEKSSRRVSSLQARRKRKTWSVKDVIFPTKRVVFRHRTTRPMLYERVKKPMRCVCYVATTPVVCLLNHPKFYDLLNFTIRFLSSTGFEIWAQKMKFRVWTEFENNVDVIAT